MKRAQISFVFSALISTVLVAACGPQRSSTGGSTSINPNTQTQSKTNQQTQAHLKILNAEALKKIAAVDNNPDFYAVQGNLVERDVVDAQTTPGLVACMTKLTNFEFTNGDLATRVTSTPSIQSGAATPIHMTVLEPAQTAANPDVAQAQAQAQGQAQAQAQNQSFMLNTFQIICLKAGSPLTPAEIAGALRGIVQIN